MIRYLLDTDILTLFQLGHPVVCQRVGQHPSSDLAVSISVEEQLSGWYTLLRQTKKRDELAQAYQRFTEHVQFLSRLQILSFTEPAMDRLEKLKAQKLEGSSRKQWPGELEA